MGAFIPTEKQAGAMLNIIENRYSVLSGAVRSGKTYCILFALPILISMHKKDNILICSKTLASIERNLLTPLRKMYGEKHIGTIRDKKDVRIFGKLCWLIAFNDIGSADRLQGMSLGLAVLDEVVICPENFFNMVRTRLDRENSNGVFTCNPGNPKHYVKRFMDDCNIPKFIDNFTIYDNPLLPTSVVESLERDYKASPTFYNRFILGKWVSADGLACYSFKEDEHTAEFDKLDMNALNANADALILGIDGATNRDKTTAVPTLFDNNNYSVVFKRFIHNPMASGRLSNIEQVKLIKQYLKDLDNQINYSDMNINKVMVVDCAAADLILQLQYEFGDEWYVIPFTKKDTKRTLEIMNNVFSTNHCTIIKENDYDYGLNKKTFEDCLTNELISVRIRDVGETENNSGQTLDNKGRIELNAKDPNDAFDGLRYALAYRYQKDDYEDYE